MYSVQLYAQCSEAEWNSYLIIRTCCQLLNISTLEISKGQLAIEIKKYQILLSHCLAKLISSEWLILMYLAHKIPAFKLFLKIHLYPLGPKFCL